MLKGIDLYGICALYRPFAGASLSTDMPIIRDRNIFGWKGWVAENHL